MTARESEDATRAELRRLLAAEPGLEPDGGGGVELRPMFGTLAALVDGHVFAVAVETSSASSSTRQGWRS